VTEGEDDRSLARSPLELLEALAREEVVLSPDLRHLEIYTMRGLLTILWHGPVDADQVVVMAGGAMGGLLGPAGGLYHDLGTRFAADGIGTMRVGYRKPNDLVRCVPQRDRAGANQLADGFEVDQFICDEWSDAAGPAPCCSTTSPVLPSTDSGLLRD